jgi:hypothetical protein
MKKFVTNCPNLTPCGKHHTISNFLSKLSPKYTKFGISGMQINHLSTQHFCACSQLATLAGMNPQISIVFFFFHFFHCICLFVQCNSCDSLFFTFCFSFWLKHSAMAGKMAFILTAIKQHSSSDLNY